MKRLAALLYIMLLCVSAYSSVYIRGAYLFSYDTNVYSEPMVRNADSSWLEWRAQNPFIKRYDNGISADIDLFFSEKGKTGLSVNFANGWAFREREYRPERNGSDWTDWDYTESDAASSSRMKLFAGIGPVFRAQFGAVDLGIALRASAGSYDYFKDSVIVGLQAELYGNVFVTEDLFLTFGMLYDAHLMEFYLNSRERWYNPGYTMLTAGAYAGIGYKIGKR